ncbi:MAG: GNAT family N-acetyltransferase [Verrucomicrobiota bacterium]
MNLPATGAAGSGDPLPIPVERLGEADLPQVRDLAQRVWPVSYAEMLSPGQIDYMLKRMYSLERLREDLRSGVVFEWPVRDGVPIGYLATSCDRSAPGGPVLFLHKLYLLPEVQGRGLGGRLLDHVLRAAADLGCRRVRLNVNKANARAIACYRRRGFDIECSVVNDIGGGFVMDDHVMARPMAGAGSA